VFSAAWAITIAIATASPLATWQLVDPIPHVFDVAGPRSDGKLVVAAGGKLVLLNPVSGAREAFAAGKGGYPGAGGEEPYIALAGSSAGQAGFQPDDLFVLQLKPAGGVLRIDSAGISHHFANVPGLDSLNGIAFDQTGAFGYRLLVTGPHSHHATVAAIDGEGAVSVITAQAPTLEGGLAVAPSTFGKYAGDLIAPDELSGKLYAIALDGTSQVVAAPNVAHGGDTGVESAGFIPDVDPASTTVYLADRGTPGNAHPGTDNLLALKGAELARAGAGRGDLLVATEGGAGLVAVRCDMTACGVITIIADNGVSHGEGHVLVLAGAPSHAFGPAPAAVRSSSASPVALQVGLIAGALVVLLALVLGLTARRRTPG
jgi:hypothetical protein